MFSKEELLMIRNVFGQANFPGNAAASVARFIAKVDVLIEQTPSAMKQAEEKRANGADG